MNPKIGTRIKETVAAFNRINPARETMSVEIQDGQMPTLELNDARGRRILWTQARNVTQLQRVIKRLL